MGFSRKRTGKSRRPRYTAYYCDLKGQVRSAGTFSNKKDADKAWQRAEAKVAEGRLGDPSRGKQTFQAYVEETWLPNHEVEATTRQGYTYSLYKHLMPEFGPMRMIDILPEHVRAWITKLKNAGVTSVTIRYNKVLLSAIFTTALNDQVVFIHPCRGVKTPTVPQKPRTIITPEQFGRVLEALPDDLMRLLAETKIETGLRWGELTELRVKDVDFATRMLTVSRAVVEVNAKFHPQGGRFLVKDYPKDREYRRIKLTSRIAAKLQAHAHEHDLADDDLIFTMPTPAPVLTVLPNRDQLGRVPVGLPEPAASIALAVAANRKGHATIGATEPSPWLFPGGQPGQPISSARLTQRLEALGISPRQARTTALFQLAAEVPAAILARTLGISTSVAVTLAAPVRRRLDRLRRRRQPTTGTVTRASMIHMTRQDRAIPTVPIPDCAVTLPDADDSTLDAFTKIRDRAAGSRG